MSLLDGFRHQLRALTGARRYARELDEEMHFHLSPAVLAASWIPARRAATIHPCDALREG